MKSQYLFTILGIFLIAFMCCEARYIDQMKTAKRQDNEKSIDNFYRSLRPEKKTTNKVPIPPTAPPKVGQKTVRKNPVSVNQGSQQTGWGGSVNPGNNGGSANSISKFIPSAFIKIGNFIWDSLRYSGYIEGPLSQYEFMSTKFQEYLNDPRNTVKLEAALMNLFQYFD